jgi:hypothetical protein
MGESRLAAALQVSDLADWLAGESTALLKRIDRLLPLPLPAQKASERSGSVPWLGFDRLETMRALRLSGALTVRSGYQLLD